MIFIVSIAIGSVIGLIFWLLVMCRKDHVSRGFDDEGKYLGRG